MHRQFLERFKSAVGLGRARMVSPSLRVHDDMLLSLSVPSEDASPPETIRYRLKSLELIGIAKHATPVAFVIGSHTDRSGVGHTRPLSRFEQQALARLRSANEAVGETTSSGRDVVGAIRATGECTLVPRHVQGRRPFGRLFVSLGAHRPDRRLNLDTSHRQLSDAHPSRRTQPAHHFSKGRPFAVHQRRGTEDFRGRPQCEIHGDDANQNRTGDVDQLAHGPT